jgi:hypothetical protein
MSTPLGEYMYTSERKRSTESEQTAESRAPSQWFALILQYPYRTILAHENCEITTAEYNSYTNL